MRVKIKPVLDPGTGSIKCLRYVCSHGNLLQSSKEIKTGVKEKDMDMPLMWICGHPQGAGLPTNSTT